MTNSMIKNAQECLTIRFDDQTKKVVDIEMLLHKHSTDAVLQFLTRLMTELENSVTLLCITNRTSPKIDEAVSRIFRIRMAMKSIEMDQKEIAA